MLDLEVREGLLNQVVKLIKPGPVNLVMGHGGAGVGNHLEDDVLNEHLLVMGAESLHHIQNVLRLGAGLVGDADIME